jgi:regulator of sigma E protease
MGEERGNGMSEKTEDSEQMTEDGRQRTEDGGQQPKPTSRAIWVAAIGIAIIIFAIRNIEATKNILLVFLGFGAVVIVHEFGHFVVAKLSGIKVEAFSIFMPPTILGIKKADRGYRIRILPELFKKEFEDKEKVKSKKAKENEQETTEEAQEVEPQREDEALYSWTIGKKLLAGETEYRIGLIPFGGFVKMLGQEDVGPVKESQDPRSFANKPAMTRAAVLAAGVTFNVISAAIVYVIVFLVGIGLTAPIVGGVLPGSAAEKAGIRAGDEVIEVGGESGRLDYSDVVMAGVLSGKNEEIPMTVRHEDGTTETVNLTAEQLPGAPYRSFGIERPLSLTIERVVPEDVNLLKKMTGLMPGDRIKAVGGVNVNSYWQFESVVVRTFEPNVELTAEHKGPSGQEQLVKAHLGLEYPAPIFPGGESEKELANISGIVPRMRIIAATRTFGDRVRGLFHLKEKAAGLKPGDIITAVGEIENPTYAEMRELTNEYKDKRMPITVIRSDFAYATPDRSEPNGASERLTVETTPKWDKDLKRVLIGIGIELDVEEAVVAKTTATAGQPEALEIPRGATITAVDGVEVKSFFDVARELKKNAGHRVAIDWRIDKEKAGNTEINVGKNEQVVTARAIPKQNIPFKQLERLYKADGPIDAMGMGYKRTKIFIIQSYVTLQRLIGGLVSTKELMGPVGILTFSYKIVSDQPFIYYVYFLGLISASLAVLNFLPMPPLDGGLVVLLIIEKIKGSALSMRTQEMIAYVGWGLVLALLLYVTFNDIARLIFG